LQRLKVNLKRWRGQCADPQIRIRGTG